MSDRLQSGLRIALLTLLILWGGHTLISYLSVDVHQAVLLSETQQQSIKSNCEGGVLCTGLMSIVPLLTNTIGRASPFLWYLILSVIVYGIVLFMSYLKTGAWKLQFTMTPLRLILAFVGFTWLLFAVMSNGTMDGQPYRRVFAPSAQVYPSADSQTIETLAEDYQGLKDRGCLHIVQDASVGVEIAEVSQLCMQEAFFTRVLTEIFCVLYLLFVFLSFGRFLRHLIRVPAKTPLLDALFSTGLGACGVIVLLWAIAIAGVYNSVAGWLVLLALPLVTWQHSWHWIKSLTRTWEFEGKWHDSFVFLTWLLISYLVFNFLTVVRPFPIGWDDLGVYLNDPRLLVSYGEFIPRMFAFQWQYITSLGFLLFGYNSWFGATTSMMMNWTAGLLSVFAVYVFGATYLGRRQGLLAALLYYTLPLVGHFSFADMKVDNAVFTMGTLSVLALFVALFPTADEDENEDQATTRSFWSWIILAGLFGGFGFAMKPTVIMVVMSLFAVGMGSLLQPIGFVGGMFLAWMVFTHQGIFNIKDVLQRTVGSPDLIGRGTVTIICLVLGAVFTGLACYFKPQSIKRAFLASVLFLGVFFASILPWIIHNNIVAGRTVPGLLLTAPNNITPEFYLGGEKVPAGQNARSLPADLQVDKAGQFCSSSTSKAEELDRYWGYSNGIGHYLGLPWRSVMNSDSAGYYVTTVPVLLLFPLLLLLPFFWTKRGRWLRWLFVATVFMVVQWIFFANGVPWYGIGMFTGIVIGLEALVTKAPDKPTKIAASIFIFLSLLIAFGNRFWQYENQKSLYTYAIGVVSGPAMQERTIPHYNFIRDIVLQRAEATPDSPYVYRIGTFIPYFIPRNLEIVPIADNQLDMFTCLNQGGTNPQLTLARMKALGFNSIIFDTNTSTIEHDVNGSLHKKVQAFLDFVNSPGLGLQAVVNDTEGGIVYILLP